MAISYWSTSGANRDFGDTISITASANGDLIIVSFVSWGQVPSVSNGYTLVDTYTSDNGKYYIYEKWSNGVDTDDFVFTFSSKDRYGAAVLGVSGLDSGVAVEDSNFGGLDQADDTDQISTGSATPVQGDGIAIATLGVYIDTNFCDYRNFASLTVSSGWTQRAIQASGDDGRPGNVIYTNPVTDTSAMSNLFDGNNTDTNRSGGMAGIRIYRETGGGPSQALPPLAMQQYRQRR